jgi:DNA-binding GntR family transcriptional regulator
MAEIVELSRISLHDQVLSRLRTMLVEGIIPPGAKLNERELCERLRVSRTPLREAIKLLALSGMVDLLPNRGAVAAKLTEVDVLNTFEVLATLEGMSGALAAERITDEERSEIRAFHYEMMASFERRDLSAYYRINAQIHCALNDAARNPVLTSTYQSINGRVQSLRFRTNQNESRWKVAIHEHELMIDALDARDAEGLRKILTQHLQNKRDSIIELLRNGEIYSTAGTVGT